MSEKVSPLEAIIQGVKAKLDAFKATWPAEVEWDYVMDWDGTTDRPHIMISMGAHGYAFPVFALKRHIPKSVTNRLKDSEAVMFSMWREIENLIESSTVKGAYETVIKRNREDVQWWAHPGCKNIPMTPGEMIIDPTESGWGNVKQKTGGTEYDPQIDAFIEGYCSGKCITSKELAADGDHFSIVYDLAVSFAMKPKE